jgi:tRNA dimethylallyltransferase
MKNNHYLVVVAGPTAVGKTATTIALAKHFNSVILSADSRQFYKELTIGTAKPSLQELAEVEHHFINNRSINDPLFSANDYEQQALQLLDSLFEQHPVVFLTGGSGLYINALCRGFDAGLPGADEALRNELQKRFNELGIEALQQELKKLDPKGYQSIDQQNHQRLIRAIEICRTTGKPFSSLRKANYAKRPFNIIKIALTLDRELLVERINLRVDQMLAAGLEKEVRQLQHKLHLNPLKTVGYQEFKPYFDGLVTLDDVAEKIKVNTRRYAKRQLTW